MFTEGLDEDAISWIKQGTEGDEQPRYPLREDCPCDNISNLSILKKSEKFLSPKVLPPVKYYSGLLGIHSKTYSEDSDDDNESVASITGGYNIYCSDMLKDYVLDSSDSSLSKIIDTSLDEDVKPKSESTSESIRGPHSTIKHTLFRGPSKENLKVELSMKNSFEDLRTPSAPPVMDVGTEDTNFGVESNVNLESIKFFFDLESQIHEAKDQSLRNSLVEDDGQACYWQSKFSTQLQGYTSSAENSWQLFVAYDACFRLCLNAWEKNCMEAPHFLKDECMVLRDAFGIQKYLLHPRGYVQGDVKPINIAEGTYTLKERKDFEKIEVEVKKVRTVPQRIKLRSTYSSPKLVMRVGTEYVQHVTALLKNQIKAVKSTSFSDTHAEAFSCLIQLINPCEEPHEDPVSSVWLNPGTGESHVFYPENQGSTLLIQVQSINSVKLGQAKIPISSLLSDAQHGEKVKWWPLYSEDRGFVGKIQLSISVSSSSDKINFLKVGPPVETLIYDLVMEASLRASDFHARNLRIHGLWKWLLNEFAGYYGVTPAYRELRYLSYIMNIAVPTKECLKLISKLLEPVLKARNEKNLTRQERSILFDCEDQINNLLAITFQNYKSLDEHSSTGLASFIIPIPEAVSPALTPAIKLFNLLNDILSQEAQNRLTNYFKTAVEKRAKRHLMETEDFIKSMNCDATDPVAISTAYSKMRTLCLNISNEIQADMAIQSQNILPSCIDLPNISASVYSPQLQQRLGDFLSTFPPSKPAPHVTELLVATADFERDLNSWNISPVRGGLISRDLFHDYIEVWIKDNQYQLVEICKAEKVPSYGNSTHYETSGFVENMYEHIRDSLNEYMVVVNRWPQYLLSIENAVAHIERAIIKALEKQYSEVLMPLKTGIPQTIEKHVQKLTRQTTSVYTIPIELGIFLNTIRRIVDVHHIRVEDILKSAASFWTLTLKNENFGERTNGITIMLRASYKNYKQAVIKMLVNNTVMNRSTKLKKILEETKETKNEAEIRERMQALCLLLIDSIRNLHVVFSSKIFVEICRDLWDEMGQSVLNFVETRKENRIWYRGSGSSYVLGMLDDVFASEMQTLQGNSIHDRDLEPPRSVIEARSILS